MADNKKIATEVLEAVGGKENVSFVTHCMTRLRFNLKDGSIPVEESVKNIDGVLGVMEKGGQFQVVIGQNVAKVYKELCEIGGFAMETKEADEPEKEKEKLTLKKIGSNIMNYLAGSMTPLIPVIITAAMFKTVLALFGPDMIGLITADSDLYKTLDFLYNTFFYFLPIFIGYTSAKKLGASPLLGMFTGAMLIVPGFLDVVNAGEPFTVFGIPCALNDYSQTIVPVLLSVWVLSYVERFFKKYIPDFLASVFTPFLTMVVMVPVTFCVLAPAGSVVGNFIGNGLLSFGNLGGIAGILAVAIISALWEVLVMSGMHIVLAMFAMTALMTNGFDGVVLPAANCATFATYGIALGAFLRIKNKSEKSLNFGYLVSGLLGGVTEPILYGTIFKYKRMFGALFAGAFLGGLYSAIMGVTVHVMGATNVLMFIGCVAGGTANTVNGIISMVISFVVAAAIAYFFGLKKEENV